MVLRVLCPIISCVRVITYYQKNIKRASVGHIYFSFVVMPLLCIQRRSFYLLLLSSQTSFYTLHYMIAKCWELFRSSSLIRSTGRKPSPYRVNSHDHPSALFMIIIWPFGLANAHESLVSVGCLNGAELSSLMLKIYSSQALWGEEPKPVSCFC